MDIKTGLEIVKNDTNKKPYLRILKELAHCAFIEKEISFYYFSCLLYKNDAPDYRRFIGNKKSRKIIDEFYFKNRDEGSRELEDKLIFSKILDKNKVSSPQIIANNNGYIIDIGGEKHHINDAKELAGLLKQIISISASKSIFIKRNTGLGGLHAFKFDSRNLDNRALVEDLYKLMGTNDFLFQETVIQHDKINEIYPESLNTVRVHATVDSDNKVEIISALMRFGSNGSVVDNGSAGGFFVPVDLTNWTLGKTGSVFFKNGANQYIKHPDTGYEFKGFEIPYGCEIEKEINKVAPLFDASFIGWDVAITNEGPLIIEGNENPHVNMAQIACGGFKGHAGFEKVFNGYL